MYQMYQERVMRSHGMVLHSVEVDVDTVMEIWAPKQMGIKATATLPLVMLHGFGAPAPTQWDGQVRIEWLDRLSRQVNVTRE